MNTIKTLFILHGWALVLLAAFALTGCDDLAVTQATALDVQDAQQQAQIASKTNERIQ